MSFLFPLAVVVELIYLALFILTLKRPGFRFWPPPGPRSWQFFAAWLLAAMVVICFFFVGLLDFDSAFLPGLRFRLPVALLVFSIGSGLGTWSFAAFGLSNTLGLGKGLVVGGPYRFTRNPQYIGDSLNILGFMILTNSWMAWAIGLLGVALNLLAPRLEEPWLAERFGEPYRAYLRRVPRFFGQPNQG